LQTLIGLFFFLASTAVDDDVLPLRDPEFFDSRGVRDREPLLATLIPSGVAR